MIIEKDELNIPKYNSRIFDIYFGGKRGAVLDIETTGLTPKRCNVILTGILTADGDEVKTTQFFAESPSEEKEVLEATSEYLRDFDYVITYNGASFDIPFLEERAAKKDVEFPTVYNLDLYNIVRKFSNVKDITGSLKQKDVERYMGMSGSREDEINGGKSVEMYYEYTTSQDPEIRKFIMLHNHDDIIQLYRILPILNEIDMSAAMMFYGYPAGKFVVEDTNANSSGLLVSARYNGETDGYIAFPTDDDPYRIMIGPAGDTEIEFPSETVSKGVDVIDAKKILINLYGEANLDMPEEEMAEFSKFPGVESGYLILSYNGKTNALGINSFVKLFAKGLGELIGIQ